MGFSGGGSNILLPHSHDGRVSQDGGALDFNSITQSQSLAGQVFYSDGTALQQLSIGAASDELRVNAGATAPEWYTPSAGAVTWTELADVTISGASAPLTSGVITAYDQLDVWIQSASAAVQNQAVTFNSDNTARYGCSQYTGGVFYSATGTTEVSIDGGGSDAITFLHFSIFNKSDEVGVLWNGVNFQGPAASTPRTVNGWATYQGGGQVTEITRTRYGGTASNQLAGGRMVVFGANL